MIKEYRKDGWPLCPCCGDDELWSKLLWLGDGERPPLDSYIKAGLSCYHCGWSNEPPTIVPLKIPNKNTP
jgi:hypothetical protein